MVDYVHTHVQYYRGPDFDGTNMPTLVDPFYFDAALDPGTVEGTADDTYTRGEIATEVVNGAFIGSDAQYVGTVTVNGTKYPVFYDHSQSSSNAANPGIYKILFDNATDAQELSINGSGAFATFTPVDETFAVCFGQGTLIATPTGETPVEDIKPGDAVLTADGRTEKVVWVGIQDLLPSNVTPHMQPVRIRAGALGPDVPRKDLIVTKDHAIYLDGYLVNASALVNGGSIDYLPLSECGFRITVYHVETEAHEILIANGLAAESFLDQPDRTSFDNHAAYQSLIGDERPIAEMPVPRILSARLLPPGIRARIAPKPAVSVASRPAA